jgi:hypothetical protein
VFTTGDGRAFATDLNSTSVNALSFGKAEAKPDGLVRVVSWGGRLLFFGTPDNRSLDRRRDDAVPVRAQHGHSEGLGRPYCVSGMRTGSARADLRW